MKVLCDVGTFKTDDPKTQGKSFVFIPTNNGEWTAMEKDDWLYVKGMHCRGLRGVCSDSLWILWAALLRPRFGMGHSGMRAFKGSRECGPPGFHGLLPERAIASMTHLDKRNLVSSTHFWE